MKMKSTLEVLEGIPWIIEHNLDDHGLDIDAGFINWYFRTNEPDQTPENFCAYLVSKDPSNLWARFVG